MNLEYNIRYGVLCLNEGEVTYVAHINTSETGRKIKILYLKDILLKYSDKNHYISLPMIQNKLEEYGVAVTRKTLYDDIELLREYGMKIVLDRNRGYRVLDEKFTSAEIKVMTDAIASSRLLTDEYAEKLVKKIVKLGDSFSDCENERRIYVSLRPKNANNGVYETINTITKAINHKKRIQFKLFDYTVHKRRKFRKGIYECSPYAFTFCDERYYLISYCEKHPLALTHFRVDRMINVRIIDEPIVEQSEKLNVEEYMESTFSMFSGKAQRVTMKFENRFVNAVIDRFGYETKLHKEDDEHFSFTVSIKTDCPEPFFAWIFKFNGGGEIIKPVKLREKYYDMLRNALDKEDKE